MTTKSPLEQAGARILALEAEVDRLASRRESNLESAERAMDKVERLVAERDGLRRALSLSGVPAQAALDNKAPPLRINVGMAREIMEVANG
ncbi:hypothetical protein [Solidesulfovibrio sp.]